jgi:hypothetical protein
MRKKKEEKKLNKQPDMPAGTFDEDCETVTWKSNNDMMLIL